MTDLAAFLAARIAEDEQVAQAAAARDSGKWFVGRKWNVFRAEDATPFDDEETNELVVYGNVKSQSEHIARHDPARVLADVAAKRRILARHHAADTPHYHMGPDDPDVYDCVGCGYEGVLQSARTDNINECPELRDLAAVYASHTDYDESWRT